MSSDHDQPGAARRELPNNPEDTTDVPPSVDSPFSEAEAVGALTEADIAEEAAARAAASAAAAAEPASPVDEVVADAPASTEGEAAGAASEADESAAAESQIEIDELAAADAAAEAESAATDVNAPAEGQSTAGAPAEAETDSADSASEPPATASIADATATEAVADEPPAVAKDSETAAPTSRVTTTPRPTEPDFEAGPDVETIVHVLRHGEVHNPKGILYGRLPGFSLSVAGRAQAGAVARALSDHDIAVVIASPLQRAQETAAPIAEQHGVLVRTDENLIEAGNTFEGLRVSVGDGALRKPRHWWKLRDPFTPSWGEPYLQIAHRMLAAVNKARVEAAGREAVLVSHQLPVWTLRRFLQGQRLWHDPRTRQCSLASLTSLVYQGDTLVDIVYSEPAGGSDPTVHGA
ncbi:broad specificity phosphatase PhoE [Nocardia bhagyanarayanae]|uniref:Broad specificity phosphatase PhoE n=1 Tax=Nocardia bhagyanarayanae TaxID=1215925 RepID=A0A543F8X4_9NOCA|nr:broad specificity phosphatase PhoE [Nocardia bhagyanarayanae]